jgi:hypothetical protein
MTRKLTEGYTRDNWLDLILANACMAVALVTVCIAITAFIDGDSARQTVFGFLSFLCSVGGFFTAKRLPD